MVITTRNLYIIAFAVITIPFMVTTAMAQLISPLDPIRDYSRMLSLSIQANESDESIQSSYLFHNGLPGRSGSNLEHGHRGQHPWSTLAIFRSRNQVQSLGTMNPSIVPYTTVFTETENSELAMGRNDGSMWQGKGRNQLFTTGVQLGIGNFRMDARPNFLFNENLDYPLHPLQSQTLLSDEMIMSPFAEPMVRADLPQRFGNRKMYQFDPGFFSARIESDQLVVGISRTSMWTGPSYENPLLLGNHAPGFWHWHIGTDRPIKTVIGGIQAWYFWGHLEDSDYFIKGVDADRYVNGLTFVWQPRFANGLEFGFHRVGIGKWAGTAGAMETWFDVFRPNPREPETEEEWESPKDDFFAKSSLSMRYAVPGAGFEFYAEYGRNDYRRSLREWFLEPEINRAHLFGFLKRFEPHPRHWFTFRTEFVMLENNAIASTYRPTRTWFEHPSIHGGFTHQGQTLGSALGPGGSTQMAVLRWYHPFGLIGVRGARVVHNNDRLETYRDYYMSEVLGRWDLHAKIHMIEMQYGLEGLIFLPVAGVELQFAITKSRIENIYNQREVDMDNLHSEITLRFSPSGWLR